MDWITDHKMQYYLKLLCINPILLASARTRWDVQGPQAWCPSALQPSAHRAGLWISNLMARHDGPSVIKLGGRPLSVLKPRGAALDGPPAFIFTKKPAYYIFQQRYPKGLLILIKWARRAMRRAINLKTDLGPRLHQHFYYSRAPS